MAEHFALLISPISIGIESIIKTFINSENLLLKVSLIFSIKGKIFLLLFIMNTSFQFYNPNQFQKYILTIVTQSFSIYNLRVISYKLNKALKPGKDLDKIY